MMIKNLPLMIAAAATTSVIAAPAAKAGGASDVGGLVTNIGENASRVPQLISMAAYIIGVAMCIFGLMKLKEYVDNPGQAKLKDALIRLLVGAFLVALPSLITMLQGTTGATGGDVSFEAVGGVRF